MKLGDYFLGSVNETTDNALGRLSEFIDNLLKLKDYDGDDCGLNICLYPTFSKQTITELAIQEMEERLNVELPPTYKKFVLEKGLLTFGDNFNTSMYDEVDTLRSHYEFNNVDIEDGQFSKEDIRAIDNMLYFSSGDEGRFYYYCFDFGSQNPKTKEMRVVAYDEGDIPELVESQKGVYQGSFDDFIINRTNEIIQYLYDEFYYPDFPE